MRLLVPLLCLLAVGCGGGTETPGNGAGASSSSSSTGSGGSGGAAYTCPAPLTDCTGDPVGTWALERACDPVMRDCVEASYEVTKVELDGAVGSGGVQIAADGTLEWDVLISFEMRATGPMSCLPPEYWPVSCPGGTEPCSWSAGFGAGFVGPNTWRTDNGQIELSFDSQGETRVASFCPGTDEAEAIIEAVPFEQHGMRIGFLRTP